MKFKTPLKFFLFIALLVGCEKENNETILIEENSIENLIITQSKSFEDFDSLSELTNKILDKNTKSDISSKNNKHKELYNFKIDSSKVLRAEYNDDVYYTMKVNRDYTKEGVFENLVIVHKKDSDPTAFLYKYIPNNAYYEALNFDDNPAFTGQIKHIPLNYDEIFTETATVVCVTTTIWVCGNNDGPAGPGCATNEDGGAHVYSTQRTNCYAFDSYSNDETIDAGPSSGGGGTSSGDIPSGNGTDDPAIIDADVITQPLIKIGTFSEGQTLAMSLDFPPFSAEAIWIENNLSFTKELLNELNSDEDTAKPKEEAALTVATEASEVPWTKQAGLFNNVESLKYTHVRKTMVNGTEVQQVLLEDLDVISYGIYALCDLCNESKVRTYYYARPAAKWYEYKVPTNSVDSSLDYLINGFWNAVVQGGKYFTPIEEIKIVIDGKDLDGQEANKYVAAGFLGVSLIPGSTLVKPVKKVASAISEWYVISKAGLQIAKSNYTKFSRAVGSGVISKIDDYYRSGNVTVDVLEETGEVIGDLAQAQPGLLKPVFTWEQVLAMFQRGNNFNKIGRLKYQYNEINLVDGFRLDSYIPGKEIISRKATDLNKIKVETFESYLIELTSKYKKGKKIRSNKYNTGPGAIDGTTLSGEYYLEIPSTNKTFFDNSSQFKNLANSYNVKIKYLNE